MRALKTGAPVKLTVRDQASGLNRPGSHPGRVVRRMTAARPRTARGLVVNSIALLALNHITALLGYVFWVICARSVSASVIGMHQHGDWRR